MSSHQLVRYSLGELGVGLCLVSIDQPGGRAPRGRVYPLSRRARARAHALLMGAADIFWSGRARGGGRGPRAGPERARRRSRASGEVETHADGGDVRTLLWKRP